MTMMREGQTPEMFAQRLESILQERTVLGHAWRKVGESRRQPGGWLVEFQAGDVMKVAVRFGNSLWLSVWTASKGKDGMEFGPEPRSLKLQWLRTARNTAHHVCAVIALVTDAVERRSGYIRKEATDGNCGD